MVRKKLSEKLTFEQRLEGGEGIGPAGTGKSFPGREPTKCKPQRRALLSTGGQCCWGRATVLPDIVGHC